MNTRAAGRLVLFAALVVAVGVRLPALRQRSWWIDELITAQVAARPLVGPDLWDPRRPPADSLLGFTIQDAGPGPLTYLLEGVFAKRAAPLGGEFWIRLPGIVAALLTIGLTYRLARRWWGSAAVAATLALWAAVFPPWVDFSVGARGYAWTALFVLCHLAGVEAIMRATEARDAGRLWRGAAVLSLFTVAAFYITPLNLAWSVPFWGAVAVLWWTRRRHGVPIPLTPLVVSAVAAALLIAPYLAVWWVRLAAKAPAARWGYDLSRVVPRLLDFLDELRREPSHALVVFGAPLALVLAAMLSRRRPAGRFLLWTCTGVVLGGIILGAALLSRFFLTPRYLVGFSIPLMWASGELLRHLYAAARLRYGRRVAAVLLASLAAAGCAAQVPSALYYARTPVHDWLSAVRWLSARLAPDDVVLCGPNADIEILWAYAGRLGWMQQVPRWFNMPGNRQVDATTTEGLALAIASGRRIWYVTPFLDRIRPPAYWRLIHEHFRPVARFPGRGEVVVLVHEPSPPPPSAPSQ
jgi:hypothetical protein